MQASAFKHKCIKWFKPKRIAITSLWKLTSKTVDIDDTWHLNITTPHKARKFIHLLDSEYSFWRNYQVTGTFIIVIIIIIDVASKILFRSLYDKNAFYKIPSTCAKCTFLFTWRVKYMNFMNLTGTNISQFFPILATSHFVIQNWTYSHHWAGTGIDL